ncbi:hypothetical protein ACIOWG_05610 [Streptomyces sp. NPDC087658]|uniref:hypothetical protein n=1 Tax=Streptomyces sp. NPDC087658 TaxID=3365800 RepID=UPI00382CA556
MACGYHGPYTSETPAADHSTATAARAARRIQGRRASTVSPYRWTRTARLVPASADTAPAAAPAPVRGHPPPALRVYSRKPRTAPTAAPIAEATTADAVNRGSSSARRRIGWAAGQVRAARSSDTGPCHRPRRAGSSTALASTAGTRTGSADSRRSATGPSNRPSTPARAAASSSGTPQIAKSRAVQYSV